MADTRAGNYYGRAVVRLEALRNKDTEALIDLPEVNTCTLNQFS
jgi:hypothetical protein